MGKNLRIELHLGYLELSFISLTTDKEAESLYGLVVGGQVRELDNYLNSSYTHAIQLFTSSCHVRGRTLNALVDIVDQVVDLEPVTRDQLEDAEKASNCSYKLSSLLSSFLDCQLVCSCLWSQGSCLSFGLS